MRLVTVGEKPEDHKRYRWENRLMITGTWMEKENYLMHVMHGQASQDSFLLNERPPDGYTW